MKEGSEKNRCEGRKGRELQHEERLKCICEQCFKVGAPNKSILRTDRFFFAAVLRITMWLLDADDASAMLQSRETIPFLVANHMWPQLSVTTDTSHKDRIASSFPL